MRLAGNTILITGGSSGIGLELAKRFLALSNKVIITGRDQTKLEAVKRQLPGVAIFRGDLTSQVALDELVWFMEQKHPDVNILINNAAVQYNYLLLEEPNVVNKTEYEISANLTAPIKLTALLLPVLLKNQSGAVVNVSSGLAISPKMTAPVYCATKAALRSFTKTLRYQLQDTPVKVFEIIPPIVATPMTEGRGKAKISAGQLVDEFLTDFSNDTYESYISKAKLLRVIHRIAPSLADRIMKKGL